MIPERCLLIIVLILLNFNWYIVDAISPDDPADFDAYPYAAPDETYPNNALICYSSMTSPDNILICPESSGKFCVKEVVELKEELCGKTQYFGDVYNNGLCTLKKCNRTCSDDFRYSFSYGPYEYARHTFCCNTNYCNSASKKWNYNIAIIITLIGILFQIFNIL